MKLHVGCGTNKINGWVNIDAVPSCQPELIHDLSKPLPYEDCSVDELKAHSVLEHFDKYMRYCVMGDWARVLKVGGVIDIGVPDFQKLLRRMMKFKYDDFVDTFFGENMWESEIYIGHYGNHKWGYSQKSLIEFLNKFGIEPISANTKGLNIFYTGKKVRNVLMREMDDWRIYSHNNKFGAKRNSMLLLEVRGKIADFERFEYKR